MHALLLAVGLWAVAAGLLTLGTTYRDPFDQLKCSDFRLLHAASRRRCA